MHQLTISHAEERGAGLEVVVAEVVQYSLECGLVQSAQSVVVEQDLGPD